ncbi:MAG: outer membrane beta-barrel protein [Bacteroidota bacterium]
MRKLFFLTLVMGFFTITMQAQSFYARLGVGATMGLTHYDGSFGNQTLVGTTSDITELRSTGLGSGLNIDLGLGKMFSPYIGVELGLNYFMGFGIKATYNGTAGSYTQTGENKISAKMFQIIPAIVITPGFEKLNPYGRFGLIIGVGGGIKNAITSNNTGGLKASSVDYIEKESGGVALGFSTALGADYHIGSALSLFAEINLNGLQYSPSKGKIDTWTVDGIDRLPFATTKEKQWDYVSKLDSQVDIPDGSSNQLLKQTAILTNVGISIGVKFSFGGGSSK